MKNFYEKVVGVTFDGRQEIIAQIRQGDVVVLTHEPENQFDPNAVAVVWQEQNIGYIPRDIAFRVAPMLDGKPIGGFVERITGGTPDFPTLGLMIEFQI